ncbi:MAG: hypothetical protein LBU60_05750 [Clostridiales bacterium]|nr:hypothetical protein [Clostridiales bacterium]
MKDKTVKKLSLFSMGVLITLIVVLIMNTPNIAVLFKYNIAVKAETSLKPHQLDLMVLPRENSTWDGASNAQNYAGGNGTEESPYLIDNARQLARMATDINYGSSQKALTAWYSLTSDINMGGSWWTPVGGYGRAFAGVFNGDGHTISNMYVRNDGKILNGTASAIFGLLGDGAVIGNVELVNISVTREGSAGSSRVLLALIAAQTEPDASVLIFDIGIVDSRIYTKQEVTNNFYQIDTGLIVARQGRPSSSSSEGMISIENIHIANSGTTIGMYIDSASWDTIFNSHGGFIGVGHLVDIRSSSFEGMVGVEVIRKTNWWSTGEDYLYMTNMGAVVGMLDMLTDKVSIITDVNLFGNLYSNIEYIYASQYEGSDGLKEEQHMGGIIGDIGNNIGGLELVYIDSSIGMDVFGATKVFGGGMGDSKVNTKMEDINTRKKDLELARELYDEYYYEQQNNSQDQYIIGDAGYYADGQDYNDYSEDNAQLSGRMGIDSRAPGSTGNYWAKADYSYLYGPRTSQFPERPVTVQPNGSSGGRPVLNTPRPNSVGEIANRPTTSNAAGNRPTSASGSTRPGGRIAAPRRVISPRIAEMHNILNGAQESISIPRPTGPTSPTGPTGSTGSGGGTTSNAANTPPKTPPKPSKHIIDTEILRKPGNVVTKTNPTSLRPSSIVSRPSSNADAFLERFRSTSFRSTASSTASKAAAKAAAKATASATRAAIMAASKLIKYIFGVLMIIGTIIGIVFMILDATNVMNSGPPVWENHSYIGAAVGNEGKSNVKVEYVQTSNTSIHNDTMFSGNDNAVTSKEHSKNKLPSVPTIQYQPGSEYENNIVVTEELGDTTVLEVDGEEGIELDRPIYFQWYRNDIDSNKGGTPILYANSPILEVMTVGNFYYYCEVISQSIDFYVSNFSITANVKAANNVVATPTIHNVSVNSSSSNGISRTVSSVSDSLDNEIYTTVSAGDVVSMSVYAESKVGNLTYQWFRYDIHQDEWIAQFGADDAEYNRTFNSEGMNYYAVAAVNTIGRASDYVIGDIIGIEVVSKPNALIAALTSVNMPWFMLIFGSSILVTLSLLMMSRKLRQ